MVRARRILEVVESDRLVDRAAALGPVLLGLLHGVAGRHPEVSAVRPRGLLCAFPLPDAVLRDAVLASLRDDERVLLLAAATAASAFAPP